MRFAPHLISTLSLAFGLLFSTGVYADYAEVNRLLRAGQFTEATTKADQFLATKPKDAQMRFLKGVILTEQGKPQDAITVFTKLIEDYPELPEPYNNLAVLQAGQGQFDKARAALEMAIRTNPSYATAHENLGDVYAKLASQAYSKALQLDGSNTAVQPKLGLIRDLFTPNSRSRPSTIVAAAAVTPPVPATPAAPPATAKPSVAPTPPVAVVTPAKPAASAPTVAAVTPAVPTTPATPPVAAATAGTEEEVRAAVLAWASAWSRRDTNAYFATYGKEFDAPGGRKGWEEERKKRILGKNKISVKVSNLDVKINGNKAQARFKQDYDADSLSVTSRKTLEFLRSGDRWVIVRELSGG